MDNLKVGTLWFLFSGCFVITVQAECRMIDTNSGNNEHTFTNLTLDSCKDACVSFPTHPCVASLFTSSTGKCVVITGITTNGMSKQYVKNVTSCQDFSGRYSLQEAGTSSENTAIGVSSATEDTCKTTCAADVRCLVAVYQSTNETCSLYNMAAVSMTSSLQPKPGVVLLQWEPLSSTWTYVLIAVGGVVLLIIVALVIYFCACRKKQYDPDSDPKIKKMFDPENPPPPVVKSKEVTKFDKLIKKSPAANPLPSLYELLYYNAALDGDAEAVHFISQRETQKTSPMLLHLGDTICQTYFDKKGPFQLSRVLMCESFTDCVRLVRKGGSAEYDANFFLAVDNLRVTSENLNFPFGLQSPYAQIRLFGDNQQIWHEFVDNGFLSPYRLKERLYKNLRQSYIPLCVGNSRVDGAYIVGISEFSSVSIFEQRIESSIGNGISKVTPTAVPYKSSVPRSHYDVALDLVLAVECEGWPLCANEWVNRERKFDWPPRGVVEDILRRGVHLVPRSPSPNEPLCFRVSFTSAEQLLGNSLSPTRQQVYLSAKQVLKYLLSDEGKELNDSSIPFAYCLKNILFYRCEELASAMWYRGDRMPERLFDLLSQLEQCLSQGLCPHYFIPSHNILNCSASEAELRRAAGMVRRALNDDDMLREALPLTAGKARVSRMATYRFRMAHQKIEKLILDAAASPSAVYERSSESSALIGGKSQSYGTTIMA